ncbi:MAG: branched-chain amino acid ABC transporter permease, partial [Thermodesulfobacteriota bacterium]
TKTGKAMRAVAEDKDTAALMGIDVDRIIVTTFVVGSALAAVAGVMVGMYYTQINHMMGFLPGIKAFTAAVLGGIGNVAGAMLGGYVLGLAEALGVLVLPAQYKDVIAFSLLVLILVFRPRGILGEVVSERA